VLVLVGNRNKKCDSTFVSFDIVERCVGFLKSDEFLEVAWTVIAPDVHVSEQYIWVHHLVGIR
jgi:hypothetical protein